MTTRWPTSSEWKSSKKVIKSQVDYATRSLSGPYNLVFHGIEADWMEEEMADDPDFKRDVLEQRIRKIIKEEVSEDKSIATQMSWEYPFQAGMIREVPLLDVYRYEEGPKVKDSPPVVVSFKYRCDGSIRSNFLEEENESFFCGRLETQKATKEATLSLFPRVDS